MAVQVANTGKREDEVAGMLTSALKSFAMSKIGGSGASALGAQKPQEMGNQTKSALNQEQSPVNRRMAMYGRTA